MLIIIIIIINTRGYSDLKADNILFYIRFSLEQKISFVYNVHSVFDKNQTRYYTKEWSFLFFSLILCEPSYNGYKSLQRCWRKHQTAQNIPARLLTLLASLVKFMSCLMVRIISAHKSCSAPVGCKNFYTPLVEMLLRAFKSRYNLSLTRPCILHSV